jgi:hypothetical protein
MTHEPDPGSSDGAGAGAGSAAGAVIAAAAAAAELPSGASHTRFAALPAAPLLVSAPFCRFLPPPVSSEDPPCGERAPGNVRRAWSHSASSAAEWALAHSHASNEQTVSPGPPVQRADLCPHDFPSWAMTGAQTCRASSQVAFSAEECARLHCPSGQQSAS